MDLDLERDGERDFEREADRFSTDLLRRSSAGGDGEREPDLAPFSSFPFSMGDPERLRDFLLTDFSLERLRESRSDFSLVRELERDLERLLERLFDRDFRSSERERDLRVRERDFLEGDFLPDLERERCLLLLRERDLERDLERLPELRLLLRERRRLRDLERLPE